MVRAQRANSFPLDENKKIGATTQPCVSGRYALGINRGSLPLSVCGLSIFNRSPEQAALPPVM